MIGKREQFWKVAEKAKPVVSVEGGILVFEP